MNKYESGILKQALIGGSEHKGREQINALDADAAGRLMDALGLMELTPIAVSAYIVLYTGMRCSEICGLQWRDIDPRKGVSQVARSIKTNEGVAYVRAYKPVKVRSIPLPAPLLDVLTRWSVKQRQAFAELGAAIRPDSFVVGDASGFYRPSELTKGWASVAGVLDVRGAAGRVATFHDLRHTFATFFIANGGDAKTAASILGHSSAAATPGVRTSTGQDTERRAERRRAGANGQRRRALRVRLSRVDDGGEQGNADERRSASAQHGSIYADVPATIAPECLEGSAKLPTQATRCESAAQHADHQR